MKRDIYYLAGPKFRRILRRIYYLPADILDSLSGKRDKLTPPKGRVFIGSGDFVKQGNAILQQLIELGGLKKNARVLDVGCGIGRLAVPLTKYLDENGSYEGFDIVKSGIDWCEKNIGRQFPNFNFTHINLKNDLYNLETETEAKEFIFPYGDNEFDFVFLTSVFTHMMPADVEAYLKQIHRVLKNEGTCFATFFIMNRENKTLMQASNGIKFNYNFGNYYQHNFQVKEANIAFEESFLDQLFAQTGLKTMNKYFGYWSGRGKEHISQVLLCISQVILRISQVFLRISQVFLRISQVFLRISQVFLYISQVFLQISQVVLCFLQLNLQIILLCLSALTFMVTPFRAVAVFLAFRLFRWQAGFLGCAG